MSSQTPTFDEMMALFLETREQIKETDQLVKEYVKKQDESIRKQEEAAKKQLAEEKKWNKRFAEFSDRLGDLIATMVRGGIVRLFQELGYSFSRCSRGGTSFRDDTIGVHGEIDLFLEDGDYALLVEVKLKLSIDDVKDHIERVEKYRLYADARNDKRRLIAAVGGGIIPDNVRDFALKNGLYVILQSGENVKVISPEGEPKIW